MDAQIEKPGWVKNLTPESELFVDMNRFLRYGLESLPEVENLLKELRPCQVLHLCALKEPTILDDMLRLRGYESFAEYKDKSWHLYFKKCL